MHHNNESILPFSTYVWTLSTHYANAPHNMCGGLAPIVISIKHLITYKQISKNLLLEVIRKYLCYFGMNNNRHKKTGTPDEVSLFSIISIGI